MRSPKVTRGPALSVTLDGQTLAGHAGETIATLMLAAGLPARKDSAGAPRGLWCNMGSCGECTVRVEGRQVRACLTPAEDGMVIETRHG
jgi:sarcosine oxidase subunit alpha